MTTKEFEQIKSIDKMIRKMANREENEGIKKALMETLNGLNRVESYQFFRIK